LSRGIFSSQQRAEWQPTELDSREEQTRCGKIARWFGRHSQLLFGETDGSGRAIKFVVGAVAVRRIAGLLATTKPGGLGLFSGKNHWLELGSLVLAVAEGLLFAQTTGAVGVLFAGDQLDFLWRIRGDFGKVHNKPFE